MPGAPVDYLKISLFVMVIIKKEICDRKIFKAEKDETAWLCQCKQTGNGPFCDGTHNSL
jgi:CDGSH-type Zn-finger protein